MLVEASGNLVFQLVMNSVRELYLPHTDAFHDARLPQGQSSLDSMRALPRRCVRTTATRRRRRSASSPASRGAG